MATNDENLECWRSFHAEDSSTHPQKGEECLFLLKDSLFHGKFNENSMVEMFQEVIAWTPFNHQMLVDLFNLIGKQDGQTDQESQKGFEERVEGHLFPPQDGYDA